MNRLRTRARFHQFDVVRRRPTPPKTRLLLNVGTNEADTDHTSSRYRPIPASAKFRFGSVTVAVLKLEWNLTLDDSFNKYLHKNTLVKICCNVL